MSRLALQITRNQVRRWFLIQMLMMLLVTFIAWCFEGLFWAKSVFLGGMLCMIPQWIFAYLWFGYYKANATPKLLRVFYIGEVLKLVLTCVLFVLVLKYIPIHLITCMIGFMVAQVAFWVAPLFSFKPKID